MNHEQLNDLRQRVLRNETVTPEELKAAIDSIRGARVAGNNAAVSKAGTTKKQKTESLLAGVDLASIISNAMKQPAS